MKHIQTQKHKHRHTPCTQPLHTYVYLGPFFGSIMRTIILRGVYTIGFFFVVVVVVEFWDLAIRQRDLIEGGERNTPCVGQLSTKEPSCIASCQSSFDVQYTSPPHSHIFFSSELTPNL